MLLYKKSYKKGVWSMKKQYTMDVEEKTFVNDQGEKITYLDCSVVVCFAICLCRN